MKKSTLLWIAAVFGPVGLAFVVVIFRADHPSVPLPRAVPTETAVAASTAIVSNDTTSGVLVFVNFGADSVALPSLPSWAFCTVPEAGPLNCSFPLAAGGQQELPMGGSYMNVSISFDGPVACGNTKAELNLNNPAWYDTMDVSLVDGFSNLIAIDVANADGGKTVLGPPQGRTGNEKVLGLFPLGCDICVARQSPPCGIPKGTEGCKGGTQYDPDVVCQFQGPTMGGGSAVTVRLLPGVPAR